MLFGGLIAIARLFIILLPMMAAATGQSFEVAVIRPHDPGKNIAVAPGGGRFYASVTLKYMIQLAYNVAPYQISGGPDWLDKEVWDVTAKADGFAGEIPLEQLRPMLRQLIRDRFQLTLRAGKQDLPNFALVVDKKGSKLKPSVSDETHFHLERREPAVVWTKVSMRSFASWLGPLIQGNRAVVDETGLPGEYDVELHWSPQPIAAAPDGTDSIAPSAEPAGSAILTAIRVQLGLRLESRRGPIDTFIVEHAELPAEN